MEGQKLRVRQEKALGSVPTEFPSPHTTGGPEPQGWESREGLRMGVSTVRWGGPGTPKIPRPPGLYKKRDGWGWCSPRVSRKRNRVWKVETNPSPHSGTSFPGLWTLEPYCLRANPRASSSKPHRLPVPQALDLLNGKNTTYFIRLLGGLSELLEGCWP